jgi:GNAT superfamily N-acetyltransferase
VVGTQGGRPQFSDILGELIAVTESYLTVRDMSGREQTVPRSMVAAAKRIPPRAVPHRQIVALERVAAAGWPATDTDWLGDWLLRAAGGWTSRANSVLPLGDPGVTLPEALDRVHTWYAERGLTPGIAVPLPAFRSLDRHLDDRGWRPTHRVLVQTRHPAEPAASGTEDLPPVRITSSPDPEWLRVVGDRKGGLPDVAVDVLTGARLPGFASVCESGRLVAIGRGVIDEGWLGLSLMEVVPAARRRGLARHVFAALARWGAEHGAERAYLQVEEKNDAARTLYASLGFTTHHSYVNRAAPTG